MNDCADFEIRFKRTSDPESYEIDVQYTPWRSDAKQELIRPDVLGALRIDKPFIKRLRELFLHHHDTGRLLCDVLFSRTGLGTVLHQAYVRTQEVGALLRVRLVLDAKAEILHQLRWELLIQPPELSIAGINADGRLVTSSRILFSRYLASSSSRPVTLLPRNEQRALAIISNPCDLHTYNLHAINVAAWRDLFITTLNTMPLTILASGGTATLPQIVTELQSSSTVLIPDVVILVAHGQMPHLEDSWLHLEDETGKSHHVTTDEFVAALDELERLPRLVILVACQSAGSDGAIVRALGPRLVAIGIPAVIAMQGNISIQTAEIFIRTLLYELENKPQIDRAVAVARAAIAGRPDWWVPVLWMRSQSGLLWKVDNDNNRNRLFVWLRFRELSLQEKNLNQIIDAILDCPHGASLNLADLDSLDSLIDALRFLDKDTLQFRKLEETLDSVAPLSLPWFDIGMLKELIVHLELNVRRWQGLYVAIAPDGDEWREPPEGRNGSETAVLIINRLARASINSSQNTSPLLTLVDHALNLIDNNENTNQYYQALTLWRKSVAPTSPLTISAPDLLRPTGAAYLQVVITPTRPVSVTNMSSSSYIIESWLQVELTPNNYDTPRSITSRSVVKYQNLADALFSMVSTANRRLPRQRSPLTIECFLPRQLFLLDIEYFRRVKMQVEEYLCGSYHVIVRSLERITSEERYDIEPLWWGLWETYREYRNSYAKDSLHWIDHASACHPTRLQAEIRYQQRAGIAQTYIPLRSDGTPEETHFTTMAGIIMAGVPILLLLRPNGRLSGSERQGLEKALGTLRLAQLRDFVRKERLSALASDDEQHFGRRMVLLWDDPGRLPPSIEYAEPDEIEPNQEES